MARAMVSVLASARQIFQILLCEAGEDALQFAAKRPARPRRVEREFGAAGAEHRDSLEVLALRAKQFDFTGEEVLVERREMDVFFTLCTRRMRVPKSSISPRSTARVFSAGTAG